MLQETVQTSYLLFNTYPAVYLLLRAHCIVYNLPISTVSMYILYIDIHIHTVCAIYEIKRETLSNE